MTDLSKPVQCYHGGWVDAFIVDDPVNSDYCIVRYEADYGGCAVVWKRSLLVDCKWIRNTPKPPVWQGSGVYLCSDGRERHAYACEGPDDAVCVVAAWKHIQNPLVFASADGCLLTKPPHEFTLVNRIGDLPEVAS